MDAMDAILTRRSIREYTPQPVPDAVITELLEAAMSAPSAGNEQPWHFVVINERQILDEIPTFHPYAGMLAGASVAIVVCGDEGLAKHRGFWVQDCSAATENLLIAVNAKGLGAVWVGLYPVEERVVEMRKLLGIPDHVIPFALIPIGYPLAPGSRANRYNPARIHHSRW